jgi:hypothetical protein
MPARRLLRQPRRPKRWIAANVLLIVCCCSSFCFVC